MPAGFTKMTVAQQLAWLARDYNRTAKTSQMAQKTIERIIRWHLVGKSQAQRRLWLLENAPKLYRALDYLIMLFWRKFGNATSFDIDLDKAVIMN
jgi:hypothetical protein